MIILSENNYRETGKSIIDAGKLSLVALLVTYVLDTDLLFSAVLTFYLFGLSFLFYVIGNILIRIADRKANQKEDLKRKNDLKSRINAKRK